MPDGQIELTETTGCEGFITIELILYLKLRRIQIGLHKSSHPDIVSASRPKTDKTTLVKRKANNG